MRLFDFVVDEIIRIDDIRHIAARGCDEKERQMRIQPIGSSEIVTLTAGDEVYASSNGSDGCSWVDIAACCPGARRSVVGVGRIADAGDVVMYDEGDDTWVPARVLGPVVRDATTGEVLPGGAARYLADASDDAAPTGIVNAYLDGDVWRYVAADEVDHYSRNLHEDVRTVYTEVE